MINTESIKPKIKELADKYGLSLVALFGSQASGKTHKESDVDIAYASFKPLDFIEKAKFNTDLTQIFKNDRIDIVDLRQSSPLLMRQATRKAIVLYENTPRLFDFFYAYALKLYEEAKPLFDLRKYRLNKIIAEYKHA
ncbi:MAG: nucleotidyltransferase domain-containing protein [Patescibacteria group bacterium]|nr:nucleotidyltransferase domain-containing protein [Patescibacteria group bacterium]